ncbi:MAG: type II secretion system F family protein [Caulobacteraceae bacterium]
MILLLTVEAAFVAYALIISGKVNRDFESTVGKGKSLMQFLTPVSLLIVDKLEQSEVFSSYERKLSARITELHGSKNARYNLKLYLVNKVAIMLAALVLLTLLGVPMYKVDASFIIFAATVLFLIFFLTDRELDEKVKKRNFMLQYDFPEFLNKLVLLINAGMTLPRAWEKIVLDRKSLTPLYEELGTVYMEIQNGKPEVAAYEDFARRCRVKEINKFITVVIQNQKKGNSELVPILKMQSNECWQTRKNMARRLGEEASTKLVIPLMIMFVGILLIVILPAVLQLRSL